jgi:hypothetical protein
VQWQRIKNLPFEQQIIDYLLKLHSRELDSLIWKGNKATGTGNLAMDEWIPSILNNWKWLC